jgi:hypothetical protein
MQAGRWRREASVTAEALACLPCGFLVAYGFYQVLWAVSVDGGYGCACGLRAPRHATDIQRHVPDVPASRVLLTQERARRVSP